MVEVKSPRDSLEDLEAKIQDFLALGTQVGILLDPEAQTAAIYRPDQAPTILTNEDVLTVPDLWPGWEVTVADLWPPVFEENE